MESNKNNYVLLIHGGVGTIIKENMTATKEAAYLETLKMALLAGENVLKNAGKATNAVEAAIKVMEDSPLFNAGRGAVFTHEGKNEMDASVMDGNTLDAGAVAGVTQIKNPISVALQVMQHSNHIILIGEGAERFAKQQGCELANPSYFYDEDRFQQLKMAQLHNEVILDHSGESAYQEGNIENEGKKFGTVGAVALDTHRNLAAATSTGGMTNKQFGRVGDTPIIGAGTYAHNKTCAVSCTGHGEYFIKNVVAYDISALMEYKQTTIQEAAEYVIHEKLKQQKGEGGLIALDQKGSYTMAFNTKGMYRGVVSKNHSPKVDIYK
ncbi:isoaspartyl peptidase/L-asparaginase family protein [uncultured Microscilla sp.]|uniref:isoaspartyl peptidase/L-asparaginase family protein n=1 Tax=uncultured Microscilla sp. TaxID=432653 RepID=UPI002638D08F|nr:isoaspartyl peptidase/L-asparaginase [uncultured Microscilla sp.]